ncbi:MAG: amino acid ABC transporter permease [Kiloniellales bacterium]
MRSFAKHRPPLFENTTDLPVMIRPSRRSASAAGPRAGRFRLRAWHGLLPLCLLVATAFPADAQSGSGGSSILATLVKWMPLLLSGFVFNLAISVMAMAVGTVAGLGLGLMQISQAAPVRKAGWVVTQFFRNAPWLVLLFFCMFLLPFEFTVLGLVVPFPDWVKATIGFALPVMANVSEILRGAVQSLPSGQWESAESLAFDRRQTLWMIILPQCIKRMLPPWMNLYSLVTMATVLASVVGVSEMLTLTAEVHAAEGGRPELLAPLYAFALLCFFAYCYPIGQLTARLERRYRVIS